MSLEAARNLSIPDLLRVFNEKLDLESARLRGIRLPPIASTASLETDVSVSSLVHQQTQRWGLIANPADKQPRSQSTRCPEAGSLNSEPITVGEQVIARGPLPNHWICPPRARYGRMVDYSADSRVSVLARTYSLDAVELDVDIQQEPQLGGVEPTTRQGSASETLP